MGPFKFWRLSNLDRRLSLLKTFMFHLFVIWSPSFLVASLFHQVTDNNLANLLPNRGACCVGAWTILNASSWESSPHIRAPWSVMSVSHMVPCQVGRRKTTALRNGWWKCHGSSWYNTQRTHIQDIVLFLSRKIIQQITGAPKAHYSFNQPQHIQIFHFHALKLTATE